MQEQLELNRHADFQRKKQAVHVALCSVLTREEADGAVQHWAQHFLGSRSVFNGLNLFARKVCETYGKPGCQGELVQAMSRALMRLDVEHAATDAEAELADAAVTPGLDDKGEMTAEFSSFQLLLLAILQDLTLRNADLGIACREFLLEVVENLPWSPPQQEQLIRLVGEGETRQLRAYRPGQLRSLMQHLTVWMRDILGEELAASMIYTAIRQVERTPQGRACSPREFLDA